MNGSTYASYDQRSRGPTMPMKAAASRPSPVTGRSAGLDAGAGNANAISVMRRLGACLDEEVAALDATPLADLTAFNGRKGQGLMELNRVLATVGPLAPGSAMAVELAALRKKIDHNMRVLRLHVAAVKEITGALTDAIQSEESDGTYSPSIQGKHGARW